MSDPLMPLEVRMDTRWSGTVRLDRDPLPGEPTPLSVVPPARLRTVMHESPLLWSVRSGYRIEDGEVVFVFAPEHFAGHDWPSDPVRVAGPFNDWSPDESWTLVAAEEHHRTRLVLRVPEARVFRGAYACVPFKFHSVSGNWFQPRDESPNRVNDPLGRTNLEICPDRTGRHVLRFVLTEPPPPGTPPTLLWGGESGTLAVPALPGGAFLDLWTPRELGVSVGDTHTEFRLFAPRATGVLLETVAPDGPARSHAALACDDEGVWSVKRPGNLHGRFYRYFVSGDNHDASTAFDAADPVLDPYAVAAAGPGGPAIVYDTRRMPSPDTGYRTPRATDLVIAEAHLRDLLTLDPEFAAHPRPGFRELAAFLRKRDCPLRDLGINAIELLPVQEIEAPDPAARPKDFAWGYMPVNWFAPASLYASKPEAASQVEEFADLVRACHEAGFAVILDVVYNHYGAPNALLRCDKHHFFTEEADGSLTNWSGCGNDFRADTPMGVRLIADSLKWMIRRYGVDGFRFDLAELLGAGVLRDLRREVLAEKADAILIAEPWSFRGHIATALRGSGYASWNDGFRDAMAEWVRGGRDAVTLAYFLTGSPAHFATCPGETVNYTESHDDRCWLDRITENPLHNALHPTPADIARTRLMFACLFAALGVPMFAAGQEFLRTKSGVNNTYLRGDLSKLTRERSEQFADTRDFVRGWIALRTSPLGACFRRPDAFPAGWFSLFPAADGRAFALLYNAPADAAGPPVLFAANPNRLPVEIPCAVPAFDRYRLFADDRTAGVSPLAEREDGPRRTARGVLLPPLSAAAWVAL